ncbi:hypothetical protein [Kerstersia gyiorum]|uniref:hypothetical protein n=1 Tax=Kerstersia gyiorum TaxID=206506 RepID=UPI00209EA22F|nr:hypothetical protein [Kerstersia gyiorum]MCP1679438.1 hypothetical protein [Kerstersia gyiorum]MCP1823941.1 hypothetical protein [Kerstersia gyiorum]MCP1827382.1 hypothetical protein [Kerstersia gyiorum]MCW2448969.1 hypothetical protein [Kerstersia gyiorum]
MKLVTYYSSRLPDIPDTVKECVNQGKWILYTSSTQNRGIGTEFFLKTDSAVYELDGVGRVVYVRPAAAQIPDINELINFSDLPYPSSLSNGMLPMGSPPNFRLYA